MTTPTPWDSRTLRTAFATGDEMVVIQPAGAGTDFVRLPWSVLEDLIDAAGRADSIWMWTGALRHGPG